LISRHATQRIATRSRNGNTGLRNAGKRASRF